MATTVAGIGASHQTGWTGVVGLLIDLFGRLDPVRFLTEGRASAFARREVPTNPCPEKGLNPGRTARYCCTRRDPPRWCNTRRTRSSAENAQHCGLLGGAR